MSFKAALDNLPRTNNNVEAWHHGFESIVTVHHENIWKIIHSFGKEPALHEVTIQLCVAEGPHASIRLQHLAQECEEKVTGIILYTYVG